MKKCPYCGKEYSDDVTRCLVDNELLSGQESQPPTDQSEIADPVPPSLAVASLPTAIWTERQLCIIEIVLVCTIAFGGSILVSGHFLFFGYSGQSSFGGSGLFGWLYRSLFEASALGLLWYVLLRHGKNFSSLGLSWKWKDIGWSIVLLVGGAIAFYAVYAAIHFSGLPAVSQKTSSIRVADGLFGGGISVVTIVFLCLNPFFEELIVRAYLMTEIKKLTNSTAKAIIASMALQTSYHFYQGVPLALADGALFLIYSIYYAKTNRIAPIILAHLYCDVGSTFWYLLRQ